MSSRGMWWQRTSGCCVSGRRLAQHSIHSARHHASTGMGWQECLQLPGSTASPMMGRCSLFGALDAEAVSLWGYCSVGLPHPPGGLVCIASIVRQPHHKQILRKSFCSCVAEHVVFSLGFAVWKLM